MIKNDDLRIVIVEHIGLLLSQRIAMDHIKMKKKKKRGILVTSWADGQLELPNSY